MLPAYLIRAAVDYTRHADAMKDSNPYSRCEEALKLVSKLWQENIGRLNASLVEVASVTAYWEEFFHAEDPLPDEKEWREGLAKRSGNYDSFEEWQEGFKKSYKSVYQENNVWTSVLMTAWASTHQYQLVYDESRWDFIESKSYLPTSQVWRLEPNVDTVGEVLKECWRQEVGKYEESGFHIVAEPVSYLGRVECLGFDQSVYRVNWPVKADREPEVLDLGTMIADIVVPVGDSWYRQPDNIIFAHDHVDVTALVNRAQYIFGSKRRVLELTVDYGPARARLRAGAEGWLVQELEDEPEEELEESA
ncbi:MAG TPA: hypothetical protein PKD05_02010 [Candidatus Melainabacteria bacterium]|nr:hypothetical protein [Candidatus Melainabacteria bacterium]